MSRSASISASIDDALQTSDLLIAIVGHNWLGSQPDGKTRIANAADPVRVELETALRRDLTVLPVLLDDASMPDPAELPETIRDFAYRNALEVFRPRLQRAYRPADPRRRADSRRQVQGGAARCRGC